MPPRNARSTAAGQRFYDWKPSGERFYSVTTIINGGCPKPALLPWGIRSVAEGAVKAVQDGHLVGMIEHDADAAVKFLKELPYAHRDRAANLGTVVHDYIDALNLGRPMPAAPVEAKPYLRQAERWFKAFRPRILASEEEVYNRSEKYAGRLDLIAEFPGRGVGLVDFKTGARPGDLHKGPPYRETALQLNAYSRAEFIGAPDGTEHQLPTIDFAAVLYVWPEGYLFAEVELSERIWGAFLYCREVYRWMTDLSKQAFGDLLVPQAEVVA
jgi:hypothetical protein